MDGAFRQLRRNLFAVFKAAAAIISASASGWKSTVFIPVKQRLFRKRIRHHGVLRDSHPLPGIAFALPLSIRATSYSAARSAILADARAREARRQAKIAAAFIEPNSITLQRKQHWVAGIARIGRGGQGNV